MYIGSSFTIFPRSLKQAAHGAYRVNIDINIFNETWGLDREEHFILPSMDRIFLSGGNTNQGVGIAISRRMMKQISSVSFHAYSPRLCLLNLTYSWLTFSFLSCYFPISWDAGFGAAGCGPDTWSHYY